MNHVGHSLYRRWLPLLLVIFALGSQARAQNWSLVVRDVAAGTPTNQINGVTGGVAILYATLLNFTGTDLSDDGTGLPAPATSLDFAGFGWILNPGQTDLESRFTPAAGIPGFPQVPGSADGVTPGGVEPVILGTFDLTGLPPGIHEQDFVASAFPTDIASIVVFDDISGVLQLNVGVAAAPEPVSGMLALLGCFTTVVAVRLRCQRY
jgi:hypothetical protein